MGTLCLPQFPISCFLQNHHSALRTHRSAPSISLSSTYRQRVGFSGRGRNSKKPISNESLFLDESGAVEDMDGYLNHLSLEYDSVWDTKPSWCQPWTITLTGVSITGCSWLIWHSVVATAVVLALTGAWWYIFLYSYPKAYSDMIAERRKKVTNGVEDTYGGRKA